MKGLFFTRLIRIDFLSGNLQLPQVAPFPPRDPPQILTRLHFMRIPKRMTRNHALRPKKRRHPIMELRGQIVPRRSMLYNDKRVIKHKSPSSLRPQLRLPMKNFEPAVNIRTLTQPQAQMLPERIHGTILTLHIQRLPATLHNLYIHVIPVVHHPCILLEVAPHEDEGVAHARGPAGGGRQHTAVDEVLGVLDFPLGDDGGQVQGLQGLGSTGVGLGEPVRPDLVALVEADVGAFWAEQGGAEEVAEHFAGLLDEELAVVFFVVVGGFELFADCELVGPVAGADGEGVDDAVFVDLGLGLLFFDAAVGFVVFAHFDN